MSDGPRYVTLRDYVRVLRAQRLLIFAIFLAFAGGSYLYFSQQPRIYAAEASMAFKDPTRDLELVGPTPGESPQSPDQRAIVAAETLTDPPVATRVKKALRDKASVASLIAAVTARPEARTNLVIVEGRSSDPRRAAQLANEFARQAALLERRAYRRRLGRTIRSFQRRIIRQARRSTRTGSDFLTAVADDRLAQLQSLRDFAEPAQIVRPAAVPGAPASPKVAQNTLFGALLGLTVALVVAFSRDALDRRLRAPKQVEQELGLPLLGHVSEGAMAAGMAATNGRPAVSSQDAEGFHVLRTNLDFLDPEKPLRTVAVTSAVAQEGKTTVAMALAHAYASAGRHVLLLECDLRRPSLAGRLRVTRAPGLSEFLLHQAGSTEIVRRVDHRRGKANGRGPAKASFDCVVAGEADVSPVELLQSQGFHDLLPILARAYDIVLLDCPPVLPVADALSIVPHVDAVLLCLRASSTRREQARAAKAALERFPPRPTGIVLTGVRPAELADYGYDYAS
jgi:tyrosine-protein kinase